MCHLLFLHRSKSDSDKSDDSNKSEDSKNEPDSSLYSSIGISGLLLALGLGTCGEVALIGALIVYFFRVSPEYKSNNIVIVIMFAIYACDTAHQKGDFPDEVNFEFCI